MTADQQQSRSTEDRLDKTAERESKASVSSKAGKQANEWGSGDRKYDLPMHHIRNHWMKHDIEIVVLVEGVDASTSHLIQARHSYTIDDVEFDKDFAPCVFPRNKGGLLVDFTKFHDLVPAAPSF
jgi:hypothetical protein